MVNRSWYLIYCKPKQESIAKLNLEYQDYLPYLPMANVRKLVANTYKLVKEPFFPRYLFISLSDRLDDWGPIRSTRGVSNLVRFGGLPAKVPEQLIANLRKLESDHANSPLTLLPEFHVGQSVSILTGPLQGYEGVFHDRQGKTRAIVLLKLAEKFTKVQLDLDQLH